MHASCKTSKCYILHTSGMHIGKVLWWYYAPQTKILESRTNISDRVFKALFAYVSTSFGRPLNLRINLCSSNENFGTSNTHQECMHLVNIEHTSGIHTPVNTTWCFLWTSYTHQACILWTSYTNPVCMHLVNIEHTSGMHLVNIEHKSGMYQPSATSPPMFRQS